MITLVAFQITRPSFMQLQSVSSGLLRMLGKARLSFCAMIVSTRETWLVARGNHGQIGKPSPQPSRPALSQKLSAHFSGSMSTVTLVTNSTSVLMTSLLLVEMVGPELSITFQGVSRPARRPWRYQAPGLQRLGDPRSAVHIPTSGASEQTPPSTWIGGARHCEVCCQRYDARTAHISSSLHC